MSTSNLFHLYRNRKHISLIHPSGCVTTVFFVIFSIVFGLPIHSMFSSPDRPCPRPPSRTAPGRAGSWRSPFHREFVDGQGEREREEREAKKKDEEEVKLFGFSQKVCPLTLTRLFWPGLHRNYSFVYMFYLTKQPFHWEWKNVSISPTRCFYFCLTKINCFLFLVERDRSPRNGWRLGARRTRQNAINVCLCGQHVVSIPTLSYAFLFIWNIKMLLSTLSWWYFAPNWTECEGWMRAAPVRRIGHGANAWRTPRY